MSPHDPHSSVCPSEDVFVLMLQQELSDQERAELEAHLDECALCSQLVVELADLLSLHDVSTGSFDSADALPGEDVQPAPMQCEGYELLGVLGAGGMGVVYRARDVTLGREVAIKVIRSDALGGEYAAQSRARLAREARMLARVNHPNVVTIHEANVEAERVYLVMELVSGASLDRVQRAEQLPWTEVVAIYLQVCDGLAAAHRVGVVHRDIKPSNIIVTPEQRAVLTDFGLARAAIETRDMSLGQSSLTRSGAILGTPAYMPPEQHLGGVADERSDIFSLCASLYASLFGERPFAGASIEEVALNACSGEVRTPTDNRGVPRQMLDVLRRGMSRRKEDRFEDASALREAIKEASRSDMARRTTRSRVVLLAISLLVLGVFGWWVMRKPDAIPGAQRAQLVEREPEPVAPRDFSVARSSVDEGVGMARLAAVHMTSRHEITRGVATAYEVAKKPLDVRAPRRVDRSTGTEKPTSPAPERATARGESAVDTSTSGAKLEEELARKISAASNRARRAFMNHDVEGCFAALDGLPEHDATVMLFLSECVAIDGRCAEGKKLYEQAFVKFGVSKSAEQIDTEFDPLCRPPRGRELEHFLWDMELFYQADLNTCRTAGARIAHELEETLFRERLVQAGHAREVVGRLHAALTCLGRSKRDECALARRISELAITLDYPDMDPVKASAKKVELLRYTGALSECVN